jgi:mRNA interferase RelE/StbE
LTTNKKKSPVTLAGNAKITAMYTVTFKNSALIELEQMPKRVVQKIVIAIEKLAENPRPMGVKKLKNSKEDLYRIRVGDYRIIYAINDGIRIVNILRIGNRKDIYRFD